jgi:methionine-rich copper-binding protein CopC
VVAAALWLVAAPAAPASAHAERSSSRPEEGAAVAAAPGKLAITFTEPPTGDAVVEVADGCGRDVVTDVDVQNFEITATLADGQPGRWTVQTNVISGIDGHNTRDRWNFSVRGEADCSAPQTEAPDPGAAGGADDEDDGGAPVALLVIGAATIGLVVVGLLVRGRSG